MKLKLFVKIKNQLINILNQNNIDIINYSIQTTGTNEISIKYDSDKTIFISTYFFSEYAINNGETHWIEYLTENLQPVISDLIEKSNRSICNNNLKNNRCSI